LSPSMTLAPVSTTICTTLSQAAFMLTSSLCVVLPRRQLRNSHRRQMNPDGAAVGLARLPRAGRLYAHRGLGPFWYVLIRNHPWRPMLGDAWSHLPRRSSVHCLQPSRCHHLRFRAASGTDRSSERGAVGLAANCTSITTNDHPRIRASAGCFRWGSFWPLDVLRQSSCTRPGYRHLLRPNVTCGFTISKAILHDGGFHTTRSPIFGSALAPRVEMSALTESLWSIADNPFSPTTWSTRAPAATPGSRVTLLFGQSYHRPTAV
jgi:hypothetical protein